uniref:Bax inhibitor 1-like n=1 Tax=Saccoglossus kowalevskii TaxID=10224 RepID=A0ABM0M1Q7_SACKO
MIAAAVGSYVHVFTGIIQGGILATVAAIGLLILLGITPHTRENQMKRLGFLIGFAFFIGVGLGPLLDVVIDVDPRYVQLFVSL